MEDRYERELQRQNMGLPCSECGSHQGHFYFCQVFKYVMTGQEEELTMEDVLYGETAKAKPYMEPELTGLTVDDFEFLKEMKISL